MNKEIWKDIKNYEGIYQVSNLGNVKSLSRNIYNIKNGKFSRKSKEKQLTFNYDKKGYVSVLLSKNGKNKTIKVHRLVAEAFIDNLENLPQVNHIDGNKTNNKVDNLEWISNYDNMQHAIKIGLRNNIFKKGKENHCSVSVNQYNLKGEFIKKWYCIADIERELGFNHSNIVACCKRRKKTAYNYIWKYN